MGTLLHHNAEIRRANADTEKPNDVFMAKVSQMAHLLQSHVQFLELLHGDRLGIVFSQEDTSVRPRTNKLDLLDILINNLTIRLLLPRLEAR